MLVESLMSREILSKGVDRAVETDCRRGCVMIEIVQFAALVLTSLSMGVHFGTWLTGAPLGETRSGALFTEVHQGRDRVAARVMPILGNAAILSVAACVVLARAVGPGCLCPLARGANLDHRGHGGHARRQRAHQPASAKLGGGSTAAGAGSAARSLGEAPLRTVLIVSGLALLASSVVFFTVP